jgi:hypothetical protein
MTCQTSYEFSDLEVSLSHHRWQPRGWAANGDQRRAAARLFEPRAARRYPLASPPWPAPALRPRHPSAPPTGLRTRGKRSQRPGPSRETCVAASHQLLRSRQEEEQQTRIQGKQPSPGCRTPTVPYYANRSGGEGTTGRFGKVAFPVGFCPCGIRSMETVVLREDDQRTAERRDAFPGSPRIDFRRSLRFSP